MNPRDYALQMNRDYGVGIIPLASGSKRPAEADWNNKARTTPEEIEQLDPGANYGVLCEGITVVDFDPRNMDVRDPEDESEVEWMIHLIREAYDLGETFEVVTGGGGTHLYYRGETKARKLENGVDIKTGKKHQVVGPGSKHPGTGRDYRIWREAPLSPLPTSFGSPVSNPSSAELGLASGGGVVEFESADIPEDGFGEGDRNNGLYRNLCKYRAMGMGDKELEMYARMVNHRHIHPPLPDSEVALVTSQALKHTPGTMAMDTLMVDAINQIAPLHEEGSDRQAFDGWITMDQLFEMKEPEYLIENVIPRNGVGHLVGESYAGKTFVALHLALSLAQPECEEWMGHKIREGGERIAYIAMEGGFDLGQRVRAWTEFYGEVPVDSMLFLVEQPFDLMNGADGISALKELRDFRPSVVFIDTQSLAAPRANENDNGDMTALMSTIKLLSQGFDSLFILVHHAGYSANRARGASAQFANMDVSLYVEGGKKQDDLRTLKVTKLKSGRVPDDMLFALQPSGNSVVVDHYVATPETLAERSPDVFEASKTQQLIIDLLERPDVDCLTALQIAQQIDRAKSTVLGALPGLLEAMQVRPAVPVRVSGNLTQAYEFWPPDERNDSETNPQEKVDSDHE